jgi:hypothetical protein
MESFLDHAGRWFLQSGIQEADGGVARYRRTDLHKNAPVSTEITGYAVSTLVYLYERTSQDRYRDAAVKAAHYLTRVAWDESSFTFPFELGSDKAYFFDIGIIIRGLLAAHRMTGEAEFHDVAHRAALSLAFDFLGEGVFHPIISLPEKQPLLHEPQWSREPGCYQLKAALAWHDLGDPQADRVFESVVAYALATHEAFLPGTPDPEKVMDRLHAYGYFLEALLAVQERPEVRKALAEGIGRTANYLREISPRFERSDVCAQLLRVRLIAHHLGAVPLDETAAREEVFRLRAYQFEDTDPALDGGFWFGRKGGELLPYSNPVSTAFGLQALALWQDHELGHWTFLLPQLI